MNPLTARCSGRYNPSDQKLKPNWLGLEFSAVPHYKRIERLAPWLFGSPIGRQVLSESTRKRLVDELRTDVEKLKAFTGYSFDDWKI